MSIRLALCLKKKDTFCIRFEDIENAHHRIRNSVLRSPCAFSQKLSQATSCQLFLKLENLQMTGAYKQRGALNKILQLSEEEKQAGVITSSAGNHAQAVAYAAQCHGIQATIVMPQDTPLSKVRGTMEFGAKIILEGKNYDDSYKKAQQLQRQYGSTFIHAFNDPAIIAGQGTIGLELLEQNPYLDVVIVPIGGGGLISGLAVALKETNPKIRIIGVEAENIPSMKKSIAAGKIIPVPPANTIAEGIAVAKVGKLTFPIVKNYVDDIVTVNEKEIANAIMVLLEREKNLAEGAGASGFAALYNNKIADINGKKVCVIISGGNIDITTLSRILERGLAKDGRLANLKVVVPDRPGVLAELSTIVADQRANILQIFHNRAFSQALLGEAEVEFTLETKGNEHIQEIIDSLAQKGFTVQNQHS